LKSAFPGATRQASAFADASDVPRSAQAGRWLKAFAPIEIGLPRRDAPGVGLRRREDGSVQAGRWLKAFAPIEIGLPRRDAPSVGLRRRKRQSCGRRRPAVGRRLSRRLKSAFPGATRQASAFADAGNVFRSAQAERWPKAFAPIEIGLYRRLRAGRRPSPTRRRVGAGRPLAEGLLAD
jgi:hypothetical protein